MRKSDQIAVQSLADWRAARTQAPPEAALSFALDATSRGPVPEERELALVLSLLEELGVDGDTLAATIAYHARLDPAHAGLAAVKGLVDGQYEAEKVWAIYKASGVAGGAEGLRRLLLAIIKDLRVVFILLARQVVRMRLAADADSRKSLAELAANIHAPLANRLGIWQVKWELEDLAFRYLHPDIYKRIASWLDERREDRERYIKNAKSLLKSALAGAGIEADIAGRPKHIFSIWKKMQRKQADFEHLYDIRAVRVLVKDVPSCYAALGIAHTLWPPVPSEFDDYIARPKGNHYQSLHTAVVGPEGKVLEVQIRTADMHAHAELGVAAHWRYKEGGSGDSAFERKIAQMRHLLEAKGDADDGASLMAGMQTEILEDRVYVLTPQGKVVDLPKGATVLDFAYHVHTEVGHRCQGAKVNGRIVPLAFQPVSGDRVEIITGKMLSPKRDWIVSGNQFLNTARAREKVRAWFRHAEHDRNVAAGKEILDRELKRLALAGVPLDELPALFHLKTPDELFVALGIGEVTSGQVARILHEKLHEPPEEENKPFEIATTKASRAQNADRISVQGVGNLLHTLAQCCQPLPGDAVTGYLTQGKGVSIHRADCASLAALMRKSPQRVVQVEWGRREGGKAYAVCILVKAFDRKGLLKDVSALIAAADVSVLGASTQVDNERGIAELSFTLRVGDYEQLSKLLNRIQGLPNIFEVKRVAAIARHASKTAE